MKIKSLYVKNFGKINETRVVLSDGINLICGENESGKTTLHTFIRSMFYGMRRQRGRAAANDRFSRYRPWGNSSYYAGTLTFESGGKIFRLDRDFSREHPKADLICETDGEKLSIEQGDLKMLLGNVSEAVFDNTVSIGQMKVRTDENLLTALRSYMTVYGESQAAGIDVEEALYRLRLSAKKLEKQVNEERRKTQDKLEKLMEHRDYILQEMEGMESLRESPADSPKRERGGSWTKKGILAGAAIALIGLTAAAASGRMLWAGISVSVIGILSAAGLFFWLRQKRKKREREKKRRLQQQWQRESRKQFMEEKEREVYNLESEIEEARLELDKPHPLEEDIKAIHMAQEEIKAIAMKKQSFLGEALQKKMSGILNEVTDGKYKAIHLSDDLTIGIDAREAYVEPEQLSRGTAEQIYFAFRMAAAELLCQEESLPFLMDDVFVMYDDKRLENVLRWLYGCGHQILIFTCHKREKILLEKLGIPYHQVKWKEELC
ncbi:MAG: ATP-binding protein [Ruminococcus sp.]|jgi:recombinational DNA repair ATPase RecF